MKQFYDYCCSDLMYCLSYYDLKLDDLDSFVKSHCVGCPDSCVYDVPYDVGLLIIKRKIEKANTV